MSAQRLILAAAFLMGLMALSLCQRGGGQNRALKPLDKQKVEYALNCGSREGFVSEHGFTYEADKYFGEGTTIATYPSNHPNLPREGIKFTSDIKLHQTERYSQRPFLDYNLPIKEDGDYVLILQFCELNFMTAGQRVTHIYLGDSVIRPNHDTLKGGRQSQINIYVPITIKHGQVIYSRNSRCQNAFDFEKRQLRLRFKKVIDNPKIDGIIVFKGTLDQTNFFHLDQMKRDYDALYTTSRRKEQLRDQMMEGYMRKQRMKKASRNDDTSDEEFESNFIEVVEGAKSRISLYIFGGIMVVLLLLFAKLNINSATSEVSQVPKVRVEKSTRRKESDDDSYEEEQHTQKTQNKKKKSKAK